jgi:hypothetical protein
MLASQPDRRRRGPAPKATHKEPILLVTDDPELKLLQGLITGMHHMSERHLSVRHLKLVIVVYLIGKVYNGTQPNRAMISAIARLDEDELDPELRELVDKRYISEIVPTYGDASKTTYKLGSMGGTLMRHIAGGSPRSFPITAVVG